MKQPYPIYFLLILSSFSCVFEGSDKDTSIPIDMAKIDSLFEAGDFIASKDIVHGNISFAIDLFKQIQTPTNNLIYSPYSVSTAFGMLYGGALAETADQMQEVLHFPSKNTKAFHQSFGAVNEAILNASKGSITLNSANKIWFKDGFKAKAGFTEMTRAFYRSNIGYYKNPKNGSKEINDWVSSRTEEKIKDIITPSDLEGSLLVLTNAIYFHGNWEEQFKPKNTQQDTFWSSKKPILTDFMNRKSEIKIGNFESVDVCVLDYKGGTTSMMLVLPNEDVPLEKVIAQLSTASYLDWCTKYRITEVNIQVPKWKITPPSIELPTPLKEMGLKLPFEETSANFGNIAPELYVSNVMHKAMIEVNEEGAEAAASTVVVLSSRSALEVLSININRPFLYFIKDNATESILFMGQIIDPSESQ